MRFWSRSLVVAASLTLLGCGGAKSGRVPTVPATVKATIGGMPITGNVNLRLFPESKEAKVSVVIGKKVSGDAFKLETFSAGDGAPPGTYKVEFGPVDTTDLSATVPKVKPATVTIPKEGGEVTLNLEAAGGKTPQQSLLPPPPK